MNRQISTIISDSSKKCTTTHIDCIPITKNKYLFHYRNLLQIQDTKISFPTFFSELVGKQEEWIQQQISNHTHNLKEESLLPHIKQRTPLIISTNGAKVHRKRGGWWIRALENVHQFTKGYNINLEQLENTTSYRSEVYVSFATTFFYIIIVNYFKFISTINSLRCVMIKNFSTNLHGY